MEDNVHAGHLLESDIGFRTGSFQVCEVIPDEVVCDIVMQFFLWISENGGTVAKTHDIVVVVEKFCDRLACFAEVGNVFGAYDAEVAIGNALIFATTCEQITYDEYTACFVNEKGGFGIVLHIRNCDGIDAIPKTFSLVK